MKLSNKKNKFLSVIILICAAVAVTFVSVSCSKKKTNPSFAFYNVDEQVSSAIMQEVYNLSAENNSGCESIILDNTKPLSESDLSDADIIFLPGGKLLDKVLENAVELPAGYFTRLPVSLSKNKKLLPVLVDHYGFAVYSTPRKALSLNAPETYSELKDFLKKEKQSGLLSAPSMCTGKNDDEFFGFISNEVLSLYGTEKYLQLCEEVSKTDGKEIPETLNAVLDELKDLQKKGLILQSWYDASDKDVLKYYFPERNIGSFFLSLSFQRKVENLYIQYYDRVDFPAGISTEKNAIIGSVIYAVCLKNNPKTLELLSELVSDVAQRNLTDNVKLAPVNKNCYAYDKEADDVRFWAASSKNGVLPHLGYAAFAEPEKQKIFADMLRNYLRKN